MSDREERLARAGEYVLGTLDDAERATVEREMASDPQLRASVDRFAAQLAALDGDDVAYDPAPKTLWERVERQIAETPQAQASAANVVVMPAMPRRAQRWRAMALAASLMAAAGVGYLGGNFMAAHREPVVVVVLQTPQNTAGAIFEAFADNSVRIVPLEDFAVPDGKIMQVWTLYDKAVGPVSLGTLSRSQAVTLGGGQPFPTPAAEQLYEITLEPSPGSPTGKPTGPILVKGFAKRPSGA